jgi:hypothetical protein
MPYIIILSAIVIGFGTAYLGFRALAKGQQDQADRTEPIGSIAAHAQDLVRHNKGRIWMLARRFCKAMIGRSDRS